MTKEQRSDERQRDSGASGVYRTISSPRIQTLQRDIKAAQARVGSVRGLIRQRRTDLGEQDTAWLALQEVDVAHEELRVAEEELHAQAEELAATRHALDAERRRYAELFEKAPDAYLVTDEHGCVIEANRRAGALFNLDPLFFAGKPLASFVFEDDRAQFRNMIALMGAARIEVEFRIVPRKGLERWISAAAQGASHGTRETPVIRWLIRDVHESKLANIRRAEVEHELRDGIERLEASKHLFDHLCEVAESARSASQTAHTARETLLSEVAHEMRTPLGAIAGWLHVLSQEHHGEVTRRALMSMTRSVRALAKLIEDLVDHAHFDVHRVKLQVAPLNVLRLVVEVVEELRPLAELKQIQLRFSGHPYRVEIQADGLRLQQLFRNLVSNAIKFTQPGGSVRVDVSVAQHAAVVTVTDNGRGIDANSLRTIFEPFVQTEKGTGHESGLGLGLSIARRIAELHGGTITADSGGRGNGSTFRVTLPLTTFN